MRQPIPQAIGDAFVAGAMVCIGVSGFLPWVRVGRNRPSGFRIAGQLRRLGIDGLPGAVLSVWPFVPLLSAIAVAAIVLQRRRLGFGLGICAAVAAGAAGAAAATLPGRIETGPTLAVAGSVIALAGSIAVRFGPRRQVLPPSPPGPEVRPAGPPTAP
jgi:hypothetical protein